jgi:hypothetical protein
MKGEFRTGMYAKIMDKDDPKYNTIGLVKAIDESPKDYDILTLEWVDGSVSDYKDYYDWKNGWKEVDPIMIVLSRDYAIEWLSSLHEEDKDERIKEFYDALEAEFEKSEKKKTKRELERERIEKIYEEKTPEQKELKVITKKAPKRFTISQQEKKARGIFQSSEMKFKQTILDYTGIYNVNPFETSGFTDLKSLMASDFEELLSQALKGKKGQRKFIIKLITPRYNLEGKRQIDDKVVNKDFRNKKTEINYEDGKESKSVGGSANYGFSLGRHYVPSENKENIKDALRRWLKDTMKAWENSLVSKYMGMYSKIDISGIMLEEVMESEEVPF